MNYTKIFPIIIIILSYGVSFFYAINKDWRMFLYWFFAGGINICANFKF